MSATPLLIVEDDDNDLFLLQRALERARVANPVHAVRSGAEFTKYLMGLGPYRDRAAHPLPGLIFLDLKLPDMQGTDVLRFLESRKNFSDIIVVVWTSAISPSDTVDVKDLDIKCCVIKPHSPETLNETIRGLNDLLKVQGHRAVLEFEQRTA